MMVVKEVWVCCEDGSAVPLALYREQDNKKFFYMDLDKIYEYGKKIKVPEKE